jgi:hypothetical protein
MADFLALAATAAGLLMAASPVLQIRRFGIVTILIAARLR